MKIILEEIKIFAHHGWYDEERKKGHWFYVSAIIELDEISEINEKLSNTFNYELAYEIVKDEMQQPKKLLETVAENITKRILHFKQIKKCIVKIMKENPFKMEGVKKVGVELERSN
jgi:7,8-dihydroneopterin aldolase/epimerase/oxygenase